MTASDTQQSSADFASPPETSQFDFWLGEWDVAWEGGSGTNTIRLLFGGHVVEEQFRSENPPFHGMSLSVYNSQQRKWQQTWVDNQGGYLVLDGQYTNNRMILAMQRTIDERLIDMRMVFYNIAAD